MCSRRRSLRPRTRGNRDGARSNSRETVSVLSPRFGVSTSPFRHASGSATGATATAASAACQQQPRAAQSGCVSLSLPDEPARAPETQRGRARRQAVRDVQGLRVFCSQSTGSLGGAAPHVGGGFAAAASSGPVAQSSAAARRPARMVAAWRGAWSERQLGSELEQLIEPAASARNRGAPRRTSKYIRILIDLRVESRYHDALGMPRG